MLIASCPLHFAPCLLQAVIALRRSRGAALLSAGLVEAPGGLLLVPKQTGLCRDLAAYLASTGLPASRVAALSLGWEAAPPPRQCARSCFEESLQARKCVRMPASVRARSRPFISETWPSQATGQKAKHPGKSSRSIRE